MHKDFMILHEVDLFKNWNLFAWLFMTCAEVKILLMQYLSR